MEWMDRLVDRLMGIRADVLMDGLMSEWIDELDTKNPTCGDGWISHTNGTARIAGARG